MLQTLTRPQGTREMVIPRTNTHPVNNQRTKVIASLIERGHMVLDESSGRVRVAVLGLNVGTDKLVGPAPKGCSWRIDCYRSSNPPANLGQNASIVLFTKFVDHSVVEKLTKDKLTCPFPLVNREIRGILLAHGPLLLEKRVQQANGDQTKYFMKPAAQMAPAATLHGTALRILQINGNERSSTMDQQVLGTRVTATGRLQEDMAKFAELFRAEAIKHDGLVGKMVLGKIRTACGITGDIRKLSRAGFIAPVVRDGTGRAGRYKAGPKMPMNGEHEKFNPTDPVSRAKYLIAQKPTLLAEQSEIELKLGRVREQLATIKTAEELMKQLDALMSPVD